MFEDHSCCSIHRSTKQNKKRDQTNYQQGLTRTQRGEGTNELVNRPKFGLNNLGTQNFNTFTAFRGFEIMHAENPTTTWALGENFLWESESKLSLWPPGVAESQATWRIQHLLDWQRDIMSSNGSGGGTGTLRVTPASTPTKKRTLNVSFLGLWFVVVFPPLKHVLRIGYINYM